MGDFVRFSSVDPPRRGRGGGRGGRGRYNSRNQRGGRGRGRGLHGRHDRPRRNQHDRNRDYDEIEEMGTRSNGDNDKTLCVAVQGCCHGELDAIYDRLKRHEETTGQTVDLLLCCGDFQSLRNQVDYHSLAVPPKYRTLGSFHRYYTGEKEAPVLTIFIGGNHEASQPLQELYYGGWVAPKIYYLGAAGVVDVAGVRIGGISGIYKSHDFTQGRFERPPYDRSSLRSVYHVRNTDVYRLKCLSPETKRIDIMLSHDWPQGIEQHGDTNKLLRQKPFFRDEVQRNDLGSPPNRELFNSLKPRWWFSGHLHVKFKAQVNHGPAQSGEEVAAAAAAPPPKDTGSTNASLVPSQVQQQAISCLEEQDFAAGEGNDADKVTPNNDSLSAEVTTQFHSLESSSIACRGGPPDLTDMMTEFLALDKCLPRRSHLSIVHIPCHGRKDVIQYDPEWLALLKKTHHLTCTKKRRVHVPRELVHVSRDEVEAMRRTLVDRGCHETEAPLAIPQNFHQTLPATTSLPGGTRSPLPMMGNPQTDELLNLLGLQHVVTIPYSNQPLNNTASIGGTTGIPDVDEIPLDEDEEDSVDGKEGDIMLDYEGAATTGFAQAASVVDDNEIDLDEDANEAPPMPTSETDSSSPASKRARANS